MNPSAEESAEADTDTPVKKPLLHEDDAQGSDVIMKPMEMPENVHQGIPGILLTMADI